MKKKKRPYNDQSNEEELSFAEKQMRKYGWESGKGLGRHGQGMSQTLETDQHLGRRGLGYHIEGLEPENIQWETEEVTCDQAPNWCPLLTQHPTLDLKTLTQMKREGKRKYSIQGEDLFCDRKLLEEVLSSKSIFDNVPEGEFFEARKRANPYESIGSVFFQNRAAMKMANLDSLFSFRFTKAAKKGEILYFGDICAGPGGFSEYVLWRRKWKASGLGFTLKGPDDFKLHKFNKDSPIESFQCLYGVDGTGDVTNSSNILDYRKACMKQTDKLGLHFLMGDGGFSVEGQENDQELLTKQLVLCQFITGISCIRKGGHFICKMFDTFLPFTVSLIYIMYLLFDQLCIIKPRTSRPANSERYIVCMGLKTEGFVKRDDVTQYLISINDRLNSLKGSEIDVLELIPIEYIQKHSPHFIKYVTDMNNEIAQHQIYSLKKVHAYVKNTSLQGEDQSKIKKECLRIWELPDLPKEITKLDTHLSSDTISKIMELLEHKNYDRWKRITTEHVIGSKPHMRTVSDWGVTTLAPFQHCYIYSLGKDNSWIYREERWERVVNLFQSVLVLPRSTLIECEIVGKVREMNNRSNNQQQPFQYNNHGDDDDDDDGQPPTILILDVIQIGSKDIREKSYLERINKFQLLLKSITKYNSYYEKNVPKTTTIPQSRSSSRRPIQTVEYVPVRTPIIELKIKQFFKLNEMESSIFSFLNEQKKTQQQIQERVKSSAMIYNDQNLDGRSYLVSGLLFAPIHFSQPLKYRTLLRERLFWPFNDRQVRREDFFKLVQQFGQ